MKPLFIDEVEKWPAPQTPGGILAAMELADEEKLAVRRFLSTNPLPPNANHKQRQRRFRRSREAAYKGFSVRVRLVLRFHGFSENAATDIEILNRAGELVAPMLTSYLKR